MLHLVRSRTLTAFALVAVGTLTGVARPAAPSAHAASLAALRGPSSTATYIDSTHTYRVSYPAMWSPVRAAGVDVLLMAPDLNVVAVTASFSAQGFGPHPLPAMLRAFVKGAGGSPMGPATYSTIQGGAVHVGTTVFRRPNGTVGLAMCEFTRRHNRVYVVTGGIVNLQGPTVTRDERQLHGILLSLRVA